MNATLEDMLAVYVNKQQTDWDVILPYVVFAYRTLYNPVVQHVPFYLLFGYEPILPHEIPMLPTVLDAAENVQWNVIAQRLNAARKQAKVAVEQARAADVRRKDATSKEPKQYHEGDKVMIYKPSVPMGGVKKLSANIYDGPYRVVKAMPGCRTLSLAHTTTGVTRVAHVDNCKPYHESDMRPSIECAESRPSVEAERRVIDMLERQCIMAKHVIGQGRARAVIEHILGVSGVPPLPAELQAMVDQNKPSSAKPTQQSPSSTSTSSEKKVSFAAKIRMIADGHEDAITSTKRARTEPDPLPSTSRVVTQNVEAPWKPPRNSLSTWWGMENVRPSRFRSSRGRKQGRNWGSHS